MSSKKQRNLRKRRVEEDESDETVVQKKTKTQTRDTQKETPRSSVFAVEGGRTVQCETDQGATRYLETETEFDKDARYTQHAFRKIARAFDTWTQRGDVPCHFAYIWNFLSVDNPICNVPLMMMTPNRRPLSRYNSQ